MDKKTITIVGGFNEKLKPRDCIINVDDISKTFIDNRIIAWESFKRVYYKDDVIDIKYYNDFINNIYKVIPFIGYTSNENDILKNLYELYNESDETIANTIMDKINSKNNFNKTIHHLFMSWKSYIEKLIELFISLREKYILDNNLTDPRNNIKDLFDKWLNINIEQNLDTSSLILLFNFPPKHYADALGPDIPKIHWNIKTHKLDNKITDFLNIIKKNKFEYIGFCKNDLITRFKALLLFPIDDLLKLIYELYTNVKIHKLSDYIYVYSQYIVDNFKKLELCLYKIKKIQPIKLNKTQLNPIEMFPKLECEKIKFLEAYITSYINLYKQILPNLIKYDSCVYNSSFCANNISNDINKIIFKINKLM